MNTLRSLNVLIVEDSANDAELLVCELRRAGYDPRWQRVETEQTFVAALQSNPDLVLSGFSMPRFDGLQAFKRLAETGRDIPFILVSGTVGEDVAVEAMRAGVTDYLLKDRLGRLGSAVDRAIQEASLRSKNRLADQQRMQVEETASWSERRNIEAQLRQSQKMDTMGRLAGGVAHDFNNLLAVISSFAETLLDGLVDSEPARTLIQNIHTTSLVGADLTKQLLAFSYRNTSSAAKLDLNAVVQETVRLLRPLIGNEVDLDLLLDTNLSPIFADRSQMLQVLINLVINARDAMGGRGRVSIHTSNVTISNPHPCRGCRLQPGDYVHLEFSDTGCGMTADVQNQIFEPLFTTKPIGQGTGLGLSTVYGIVKQNGGGIEVSSVVGTGTTFSIHLPVCYVRDRNTEHGGR